jgi:hypothetical protein
MLIHVCTLMTSFVYVFEGSCYVCSVPHSLPWPNGPVVRLLLVVCTGGTEALLLFFG